MSTDRELLEMAAKAAGIAWDKYSAVWYVEGDGPSVPYDWNPLASDADALRLAVKLGMRVGVGYVWTKSAGGFEEGMLRVKQGPYAATRRAIVRAAAAIGEKM